MSQSLSSLLNAYDATLPLARATTIPSAWYTDPRVAELERDAVFARTWQFVGRVDQVAGPGRYFTADVAGEPIVVVRGTDGALRAFHNVCRHHAAAVATQEAGRCSVLRCPYHGWTYDLDGRLKGAPEFEGVEAFDKAENGLVPVCCETWENLVFVRIAGDGSLASYLDDMAARIAPLKLSTLKFFERRSYTLHCNWKVYVDNYLDGGYHVPHLHKGLNTVLEYGEYKIECAGRYCLQYSPLKTGRDETVAAVRQGDTAYYYWLYPNFMLNWYEGVMDTNLVLPDGPDRCRVIFDFYFADLASADRNRQSVAVGERVQQEDIDICEAVQRGLKSRAYDVGRLSVRREAGEHLFHRLLHGDLMNACPRDAS